MIEEYISSKPEYDQHAHSAVDDFMDASAFRCVEPAPYRADEGFYTYEQLFMIWKRSGFRDNFELAIAEAVTKSNESTNPLILYMHEFLAKNRRVFDTSALVYFLRFFYESTHGAPKRIGKRLESQSHQPRQHAGRETVFSWVGRYHTGI